MYPHQSGTLLWLTLYVRMLDNMCLIKHMLFINNLHQSFTSSRFYSSSGADNCPSATQKSTRKVVRGFNHFSFSPTFRMVGWFTTMWLWDGATNHPAVCQLAVPYHPIVLNNGRTPNRCYSEVKVAAVRRRTRIRFDELWLDPATREYQRGVLSSTSFMV